MRIKLSTKDNVSVDKISIETDNGKLPNQGTKDAVSLLNSFKLPDKAPKLLPPAIRWISSDHRLVVFERPPMKQRIEYVGTKKESVTPSRIATAKVYEVPIPWSVYLIVMNDEYLPVKIKVFARNSSLVSLEDTLGLMPLPNFYINSALCPPTFGVYEGNPTCLADGLNIAYNMVWNSGWNYDLLDAITVSNSLSRPFFCSYGTSNDMVNAWFRTWSQYTMEQILQCSWAPPAADQRSPNRNPITLADALSVARNETANDTPNFGRMFSVRLATALM